MLAVGSWTDARGSNVLDGSAPYYCVYETCDGEYMAVGAIEPAFFAELLRLLEIPESVVDPRSQNNRSQWAAMRSSFASAFKRRTRTEWTDIFSGSDACVAPVLSMHDAAANDHVIARGTLVTIDGILQAAPAPRFPSHGAATLRPRARLGEHTREELAAVGLDADELISRGIAVQS
jgi:alpha-methylacyl-CoA racemase